MGKYWSQSQEARKKISNAAKNRYKNSSVQAECGFCSTKYKVPLARWNNGRGKYCSKKCMYSGKKGVRYSPKTEFKKGQKAWNSSNNFQECNLCGEIFKSAPSSNRSFCSKVCADKSKIGTTGFFKDKKRPEITGELNKNWKGRQVGYYALHGWIQRHMGKASKCEHCNTTKSKRYEWANVSGKYKRDFDDYIQLCKKCHNNYDGVNVWQQKK